MKTRTFALLFALGATLPLPLYAADAAPAAPPQAVPAGQVYGSQLMTPQERRAYRMKMRSAKTPEERAQIRAEHHAAMQARAKERGLTLPDTPPTAGAGMGPGPGARGMGPGAGMGPGGGMGRPVQ